MSTPAQQPPRRGGTGPATNRNFFVRHPDDSVRLRIRFDPHDADLIEEAAGDTPLLLWLHRTWKAAATRQVAAARASRPDIAPPE